MTGLIEERPLLLGKKHGRGSIHTLTGTIADAARIPDVDCGVCFDADRLTTEWQLLEKFFECRRFCFRSTPGLVGLLPAFLELLVVALETFDAPRKLIDFPFCGVELFLELGFGRCLPHGGLFTDRRFFGRRLLPNNFLSFGHVSLLVGGEFTTM